MITKETYTMRRTELAKAVNRPIVLTSNASMQSKADSAYRFTQDSTFYYYSGIDEPNWLLIFDGQNWQLVSPAVSSTQQTFDGFLSDEDAYEASGVDSILLKAGFDDLIDKLSQDKTGVSVLGKDPSQKYYEFTLNPARAKLETTIRKKFENVYDCRVEISRQRAIKSDAEIEEIRGAVEVTVQAFNKLKSSLQTAKYEYQLEAILSHHYRFEGTEGHAYDPIVAFGNNACTLHYVKNNDKLNGDGLVLVDSGAKVGGYAADVTRTYAVGNPSKRHIEIHKAVERAHQDIIKLIKPGLAFKLYHEQVDDIMKNTLIGVGLMKSLNDESAYRTYFPHAISHGLGLDVHESLGGYKEFRSGMLLTVEPGIYISEEGIGVRIEDDILVTSDGNENLSAALATSL